MKMNKILLTISIFLGLTDFSLSQVEQDSLRTAKIISDLIQNQKEDVEKDSLTFLSGHLFSKSVNHKYIRISTRLKTYIHVYSEEDKYLEPIFTESVHRVSFVKDSIFDINGDRVIDLAIHWYPSSGCCLADIYDCYIYDEQTDKFSEKVEIPNPTFYPDQFQTYSMTYGQPGETEFFEFKWANNSLDTLKSYEWNDRNQSHIILTDFESATKTDLTEIPKKLEALYGYYWFVMKIKNEEEK